MHASYGHRQSFNRGPGPDSQQNANFQRPYHPYQRPFRPDSGGGRGGSSGGASFNQSPRQSGPPDQGGYQQNLYQATEFDGKRLRKAIARKTVDYNSSVLNMLETRLYEKDFRSRSHLQPDPGYYINVSLVYFFSTLA